MPSEDSKPVRVEVENEEEADDEQSLGSVLEGRKKKPSNASAGSAKPRPKEAKVKKEEPLDDEDDDNGKPIKASLYSASRSKVKKEENDDDDGKPLAKRSSINKSVKVRFFFFCETLKCLGFLEQGDIRVFFSLNWLNVNIFVFCLFWFGYRW